MPVAILPSKARNRPGHMKRTYTCQAQKQSGLSQDSAPKTRNTGQDKKTRAFALTRLRCHASMSSRWFRMTLASGYAAMSSAANTEPTASVTATEWPISASKSAAVMVLFPSVGPKYLGNRGG